MLTMSHDALEILLVVVMLLNFFVLVATSLRAAIRLVAVQGVVIGCAPLLVQDSIDNHVLLLAASMFLVKGFIIPKLLFRAVREVGFWERLHPILGFIPSLLLAAALTGLALAFSSTLPLRPEHLRADQEMHLLVPTALSTALIGYLMLVIHKRAITQTLGYLVLENGIFLFGLLLVEAMPLLIELGVLLDLFVGVFVMGITIQHVTRGFESDDTKYLSSLKE